MRLWGGRFGEENDRRVADFTRSVELDRALAAARQMTGRDDPGAHIGEFREGA